MRVDLDYGIVESDDSKESILNQVSIETLGLSRVYSESGFDRNVGFIRKKNTKTYRSTEST